MSTQALGYLVEVEYESDPKSVFDVECFVEKIRTEAMCVDAVMEGVTFT